MENWHRGTRWSSNCYRMITSDFESRIFFLFSDAILYLHVHRLGDPVQRVGSCSKVSTISSNSEVSICESLYLHSHSSVCSSLSFSLELLSRRSIRSYGAGDWYTTLQAGRQERNNGAEKCTSIKTQTDEIVLVEMELVMLLLSLTWGLGVPSRRPEIQRIRSSSHLL